MYPQQQQQMYWLVFVHDPSSGLPDLCSQQLEYNPMMQQGTSTYRLGVQPDPAARVELLPGYYVVVHPQVIAIPGFVYLGFLTDAGRLTAFASRPGLQINALLNSSMRLFDATHQQYLQVVTPVTEIWNQLSQPNDPPIESKTPPPPTVGTETPPIESSTPPPPNRVDTRGDAGELSNADVAAASKRTPAGAMSNGQPKYQPEFRLPEVTGEASVAEQEARLQLRRQNALNENTTRMTIGVDDNGNLTIPDSPTPIPVEGAPVENSAAPAEPAPAEQAPAT